MSIDRITPFLWRYSRPLRLSLAGLCFVFAALTWSNPGSEAATSTVTVAARDIESGATIGPDDLATAADSLGLATPPESQIVGESARGPIAAGEPITPTRLTPGRLVAPTPGTVVFPLTLQDERVAALLSSGDRVDVLVTPDALHEGEPRVAAEDVEVLSVPTSTEELRTVGTVGAVVLLAIPDERAPDLATIRRSDHVTVTIR